MLIEKIASQIRNDILSGLKGYHTSLSLNIQQLEDEVVQTRLLMIRQQVASGTLPLKDMLMAVNCIDVDCMGLERCRCGNSDGCETPVAHFQMPQVMSEFGSDAIEYIGSVDRKLRFVVIKSLSEYRLHRYRKRGKDRPYVWMDSAPNQNGLIDCFIFNAPFLKQVSVVAVFKDPRQLDIYQCCTHPDYGSTDMDDNLSYINQLVKDKLTQDKVRYYRQLAAPNLPNNQVYSAGN